MEVGRVSDSYICAFSVVSKLTENEPELVTEFCGVACRRWKSVFVGKRNVWAAWDGCGIG